jgi:hypothetical protein
MDLTVTHIDYSVTLFPNRSKELRQSTICRRMLDCDAELVEGPV